MPMTLAVECESHPRQISLAVCYKSRRQQLTFLYLGSDLYRSLLQLTVQCIWVISKSLQDKIVCV